MAERCGTGELGKAVVVAPISPIAAALRHGKVDNFLQGGERET
jgi:hypothetical protein